MSAADTIFALSSGAGMAGIAVIRISGTAAGAALEALAGRAASRRARRCGGGFVHPATGEIAR